MGATRLLVHPVAKPALFVVCLLPLAFVLSGVLLDRVGPNPSEYLIRSSGIWALRFLCLALAVTPLRVLAGLPAIARFRRMFGLFAFVYVVLHALSYAWFDMGFIAGDILTDIGRRPFILVGVTAFMLLIPLAATSFNRAIRALGASRWQALHRAVYGVAGLAILHFFWMRAGKNDHAEVMVYAAIVAALLGWRGLRSIGRNRSFPAPNRHS